jgi:hypothetical protein
MQRGEVTRNLLEFAAPHISSDNEKASRHRNGLFIMNEQPPRTWGWYPDPDDASLKRYWDGTSWTELRQPLTQPPRPPTTPSEVRIKPTKSLWWYLRLGLIIGSVLGVVIIGEQVVTGGAPAGNDGRHALLCQNQARDSLRSPSTASFPAFPRVSGDTITGEVDAENGFGAKIRASFQCTIIREGEVRLDFLG